MNRLILILSLFIAVCGVLSPHHVGASEELVIVGTGNGLPILKAVGTAFTKQNPEIVITLPKSIGSGGGVKAVGNDEYALGRTSRDILETEAQYGLKQLPIAKMPIVFYVNDGVSISGLTAEQACGIYSGAIRKWEEIGGGKGKIRVIKRETGDSSLIVLQETLPGFKNITLTPRSKTTFTDQETVQECVKQENAIAFGGWVDVKDQKGVRALEIERVHPSNPNYPHVAVLSLVYKEKNYLGNVKKFIDFASSGAANKAVIDAGGLPAN